MVTKKLKLAIILVTAIIFFLILWLQIKSNLIAKNYNITNTASVTYEDLIKLEIEYRAKLLNSNNDFNNYQKEFLAKITNQKSYLNNQETLAVIPIAIDILLKMYKRTKNDIYLKQAEEYGKMLRAVQQPDGSFTWQCFTVGGWITPGAISSLIGLFKTTNDKQYLIAAENAGQYLLKSKINEGWKEGKCSENISITLWTTPGAIYALTKLYGVTNNKIYLDQIVKSSNYLVALQNQDGGWSQYYKSQDSSSIDSISYITFSTTPGAIISLYHSYQLTGNTKYLDSAFKGADWLISIQNDDGMWFGSYQNNEPANKIQNYWWDHSIIAAMDSLLVSHLIKNTTKKFDWFPAWPEEEMFIKDFNNSLTNYHDDKYLKSIIKGKNKLLKAATNKENTALENYSITTILLTVKNL